MGHNGAAQSGARQTDVQADPNQSSDDQQDHCSGSVLADGRLSHGKRFGNGGFHARYRGATWRDMQCSRRPILRRDPRAPFALLATVTATGTLGMHMIIPALPATAASLGVSPGTIQLSITLYLIGLAIG